MAGAPATGRCLTSRLAHHRRGPFPGGLDPGGASGRRCRPAFTGIRNRLPSRRRGSGSPAVRWNDTAGTLAGLCPGWRRAEERTPAIWQRYGRHCRNFWNSELVRRNFLVDGEAPLDVGDNVLDGLVHSQFGGVDYEFRVFWRLVGGRNTGEIRDLAGPGFFV